MTFEDYAKQALVTAAALPSDREKLNCGALGITGEAGECADIIKKHLFHGVELNKEALIKELGDTLWYITLLAEALGVPLTLIASRNLKKLADRYPDGFSTTASVEKKDEQLELFPD